MNTSHMDSYSLYEDYYDLAKLKEGVLIIEGTSDNSIPYEMFDMIEARFNYAVTRVHLG